MPFFFFLDEEPGAALVVAPVRLTDVALSMGLLASIAVTPIPELGPVALSMGLLASIAVTPIPELGPGFTTGELTDEAVA